MNFLQFSWENPKSRNKVQQPSILTETHDHEVMFLRAIRMKIIFLKVLKTKS